MTLCTHALDVHPRDLELIEIKGYAHYGKGQWTEALQCGNHILSEQSEHENARGIKNSSLKKRAEGYLSENCWQEASADYEELMNISPDAETLKKLATCQGFLQQWEKALHSFKNLIDRYGDQDIAV